MTDEDFDLWAEETCKRLKLKPGFRKEELVRAAERAMGCTIDLREHDLEGSHLYGVCSVAGKTFVIAYRHDSTYGQRFHTVCHEVTHILRGHVALDDSATVYREFDVSSEHEEVAEQSARALFAYAHWGRHYARRRGLGIARFWDAVGGSE